MKDLLDRYLAAVGRELPERQRADITAELKDDLLARIEAREAAAGGPLERRELEALLLEFGNPLLVAGRYRKVQHLIGPEVFPFWWAALKASLAVVAAIYFVALFLTLLLGHTPEIAGKSAPDLLIALLLTFGVVTLVCALIERFGKPGALSRWHPGRLPPARGRSRGRFEILVEIGMGGIAILWWTGIIHFRNVIPEIDLRVDLAPVWTAWHWPILAYLLFELGSNLLSLLRPERVRLNLSLRIARSLAGAGICLGVLKAGHWLDISGPATVSKAAFDKGMEMGIAATLLIYLVIAAAEAWRLRRSLRNYGGPGTA